MAITLTVRYNSNTRVPTPAPGDLITVIYDIAVAADPNAYPAGGEPISFANEFREVYGVVPGALFEQAAAGMPSAGALVAAFQAASLNTGVIRLYNPAGAGLFLAEFTALDPYPVAVAGRIVVVGRPATDSV